MADMTDAEQARENRKYTLIGVIVTIIAAIAIIAAAIAIVHANSTKNASDESKSRAAFSRIADKPAHVAVDGALVYDRRGFEKDPVTTAASNADRGTKAVDVYMDMNCPACAITENTLADTYSSLLKSGRIQLRIHVVSFLDNMSSDKYSERAGRFVLAASDIDGDKTLNLIRLMYSNKYFPGEGTSYKKTTLKDLRSTAVAAGFTKAQAARISETKYADWLTAKTNWSLDRKDLKKSDGTFSTPIVQVNGKHIDYNNADLPKALTTLVDASAKTKTK